MSDIDISNFVNDYLDNKDDECNYDKSWDDIDYDAVNFNYDNYIDELIDFYECKNMKDYGVELKVSFGNKIILEIKPDERYRAWWSGND